MLIGGGVDVDDGFKWMISKAGGGNFVVIRTDDDDAYNPYIFGLGPLTSVSTFVVYSQVGRQEARGQG